MEVRRSKKNTPNSFWLKFKQIQAVNIKPFGSIKADQL